MAASSVSVCPDPANSTSALSGFIVTAICCPGYSSRAGSASDIWGCRRARVDRDQGTSRRPVPGTVIAPMAPAARSIRQRSAYDPKCACNGPESDPGGVEKYTATAPFRFRPSKSLMPASGMLRPWPVNTSGASTSSAGSMRRLKLASSPSVRGSTRPSRTSARLDRPSSICRVLRATGWRNRSAYAGSRPALRQASAT